MYSPFMFPYICIKKPWKNIEELNKCGYLEKQDFLIFTYYIVLTFE